MKHSARDAEIVRKIYREMDDVSQFLSGHSEETFLRSRLLQKAVVMSLLNIGELSKSFTDAFLDATPRIPWHDIRSARNLAAHTYEALDMRDVWETYRVDFPALRAELEGALTGLMAEHRQDEASLNV